VTEPNNIQPIIAAFDFDGTITTHDSLLPFLRTVVGTTRFCLNLAKLIPIYMAYQLGTKNNHQAKQQLLHFFLQQQSYEQLLALGETFAQQYIPQIIRPESLPRLRWHQAQNHRCILVSAGLGIYLQPWAKSVGFDDLICTQVVVDANGFTNGDIDGVNCFGPEKVKRLTNMLGPKNQYTLYAYGDSRGDRELLELADFKYYREMPRIL
jgi:HAD superfamily hydrolase (TIGR01490 family)